MAPSGSGPLREPYGQRREGHDQLVSNFSQTCKSQQERSAGRAGVPGTPEPQPDPGLPPASARAVAPPPPGARISGPVTRTAAAQDSGGGAVPLRPRRPLSPGVPSPNLPPLPQVPPEYPTDTLDASLRGQGGSKNPPCPCPPQLFLASVGWWLERRVGSPYPNLGSTQPPWYWE